MKRIVSYVSFILLLFVLSTLICVKEERNSFIPRPRGWGGHPNNKDQKPYEYIYIQVMAKMDNTDSKKTKSDLIKETCLEAIYNDKQGIIDTMIKGSVEPQVTCCFGDCKNIYKEAYAEISKELLVKQKIEIMLEENKLKAIERKLTPEANGWIVCPTYIYLKGGREEIIELERKLFP